MLSATEKHLLAISTWFLCALSCDPPFFQKGNDCVYLTAPTTFENGCNLKMYPTIDLNLYENLSTYVWLAVGRRYKFGPMFFQSPGPDYANTLQSAVAAKENGAARANCVVIANKTLRYADCFEKHPHLCVDFFHKSPCTSPAVPLKSCFCKLVNSDDDSEEDEDGNEDCELKTDFTTDERITELETVPEETGSVCYVNSKCSKRCRVARKYIPKADLILKFDVKRKKLFLTVYSHEGIFSIKNNNPIYCFTDATEKIESKVKLNFIMATISNTSRTKHVYELELEKYLGNYWCEAFQLPSLNLIKSSKVLAYKREGLEFALMLIYENLQEYLTCVENPFEVLSNRVFEILKGIFRHKAKKTRLMEIVDAAEDTCRINFLLHVTKDKDDDSYFNTTEIEETYSTLDVYGKIHFQYIANALYCEEENDGTLNWPRTKLGDTTTSVEICVDENKIPVRRLCGGNFTYGARWLKTNYSCSNYTLPPQTQQLHNITLQNMMDVNLANDAVNISSDAANLIALNIGYFGDILNKMFALRKNSSVFIDDIVEIINNLMESDVNTLNQSQTYFNATDNLLHISEDVYEDTELLQNVTFLQIQKKNYLVQISKPFYNNVFGIALYGNNTSNFTNIQTLTLNSSNALPEFKDDFILGMRLQNDSFYTSTENLTIITTIYSQDKLFVDSKEVDGKVVSVVVPEFGEFLRKPVTVWFRSNASSNGRCSFWDYGDMFQKKTGRWSDIGGTFIRSFPNESVVECEYSHLTPFALLVLSEQEYSKDNATPSKIFSENTSHYAYLNAITITGTVLSVFGIAAIFASAILFGQWRALVGTKILLQLSFAVLLEIILTQTADMKNITSSTACTAIGIFLHYIVCSKFCWMLVFALLQYSRFVQVLKPRTNHLLLKTALIGWILPLVPVVITVCVSLQSYSAGKFMFCYPKGLSLMLGVLMPISLIIIVNMFVFVLIMRNITSTATVQRQIILAVLLFFVSGSSWLFGIFMEVFHGTWFHYFCAYMFCITATLQGFILFVFYVLLNVEIRLKWKYLLYSR